MLTNVIERINQVLNKKKSFKEDFTVELNSYDNYPYEKDIHISIITENKLDLNDYNLKGLIEREMKKQYPGIVIEFKSCNNGLFKLSYHMKEDDKTEQELLFLLDKKDSLLKKLEHFQKQVFEKLVEGISKTKTCQSCESVLNKTFLNSIICPVCKDKILNNTDKKRHDRNLKEIEEINKKLNSEKFQTDYFRYIKLKFEKNLEG